MHAWVIERSCIAFIFYHLESNIWIKSYISLYHAMYLKILGWINKIKILHLYIFILISSSLMQYLRHAIHHCSVPNFTIHPQSTNYHSIVILKCPLLPLISIVFSVILMDYKWTGYHYVLADPMRTWIILQWKWILLLPGAKIV